MNRVSVAIDSYLAESYGPEIHWTWRLLFTVMGWAWNEVPLPDPCDVAFVVEPNDAPQARLCILANPAAWSQPAARRLRCITQCDGLMRLSFADETTTTNPVHRVAGQMVCQRDLIFDIFWLVTGQEERYWPQDKYGFFDLTGTAVLREQLFQQAPASQISLWLQKTLLDLGCPPPVPRWPNGKQATAGAGHDVDYPEIKRWLEPLRIVKRLGWQQGCNPAFEVLMGRRNHWHFAAWLDLEKRLQTRSAFYFVPHQGSLLEYAAGTPDSFYNVTATPFRQLFQCLTDEGFEVGLQASYLAYQSKEKFAAEKQRLEDASGQQVVGNRHHYWHLNPVDIEETLLIHEQIGLKYDSSLIHERYLGWRRGLSQPFFPFHQKQRRELKTLQLATVWMDDQLFGHKPHNPGAPQKLLQALADRAVEQGGYLLVDVHDYVFDDVLFPGWRKTYQQLWEYLLERGDFWFATPAQIAEHWARRYRALMQASQGLEAGLA